MHKRIRGQSFLGSAFLNAIATDLQAYDSINMKNSQNPNQRAESEYSPEKKPKTFPKKIHRSYLHTEGEVRQHSIDEDLKQPMTKKKTVSFVCTQQEWEALNDPSARLSQSKDDAKLLKSSLKKTVIHSFTERSEKDNARKPVSLQEFLNAREKAQHLEKNNEAAFFITPVKPGERSTKFDFIDQDGHEIRAAKGNQLGGRPLRPRMSSKEQINKDMFITPRFSAITIEQITSAKRSDPIMLDSTQMKNEPLSITKVYRVNDFLKNEELGADHSTIPRDWREKNTHQNSQNANEKIKQGIQRIKEKYKAIPKQAPSNFDSKVAAKLRFKNKEEKIEDTLIVSKETQLTRNNPINPKPQTHITQTSEPSTTKSKYPVITDTLPHLSQFIKSNHIPLVKGPKEEKRTESISNMNGINSVTNISNIHNNIAHIPNVNIHFNDKSISVTNSAIVAAYRNSHSSHLKNDSVVVEKSDDAIYSTDMYNLYKYRKRELSSSRLLSFPDKGFNSGSEKLGSELGFPQKRMSGQSILNDSNPRNNGSRERSIKNESQKFVKLSAKKEKSQAEHPVRQFDTDKFLVGSNFTATGISIPGIKGITHKENEEAFLIRKIELGGTDCGFFCIISGHGQYGHQVTQFIKQSIFRLIIRELYKNGI